MVPGLTGGTTHPRVVPAGTTGLGPVAADLLAHRSDALLYAGDAAGAAPEAWAAEAYDGIGLIARAAAATSAGGEGREGLAQRLVRTEHPGIVRTLAFSSSTRRVRYENGVFLYRAERGRPASWARTARCTRTGPAGRRRRRRRRRRMGEGPVSVAFG